MSLDPTSLDRLHDVIAPLPVPWWPPAPGWIWVVGFAGLMLFLALLRGLAMWQHNRYRREALAEWKQQAVRLQESRERAAALTSMAVLLKRVALSVYPRREVASLHDAAWLRFLDRTTASTAYTSALGGVLERVAYDPRAAASVDAAQAAEISELVHRWISSHRLEAVENAGEGKPC